MTETLAILDALAAEMRMREIYSRKVSRADTPLSAYYNGYADGMMSGAALVEAAIARIRAEEEIP